MEKHIGEEHDGIVSSVVNFGLFVQLPNLIEGLVRLDDLKDDYDKLGEAIEKAYSSDASNKIKEQNELLEKQKATHKPEQYLIFLPQFYKDHQIMIIDFQAQYFFFVHQ